MLSLASAPLAVRFSANYDCLKGPILSKADRDALAEHGVTTPTREFYRLEFVEKHSPIANGTPSFRSALRLTLEPRHQPHSS
ncbi:unnamed protein product [Schistocephalus solidus]|uniref:LEM domain-containing protein n=1 Tax=Schistocephalus solidus TaxID=70667 RepID=A0A183SVV5_SCHSO|nr:unnamed protein product [Schistocephalus solidus]